MTTPQSVLAAFAIILIDLSSRAGLDKVLALAGDPETIALWAQLQSVAELVSAVALAGVLTGLTVMVAQVREPREISSLLRHALKLGLLTSLSIALLVALASPVLSGWLTQGRIPATLFLLAACIGCITIFPATLNAYWLGKHQQQRMLRLALVTGLVLLMVAIGAWLKLSLAGLLSVQCLMLGFIGLATWLYLRQLSRASAAKNPETEHRRKLIKFVPVGLAIGIMSPVSMLLIRSILSQSLSWNDAGIMQALWRSTDWIAATAAGVLSLIFLPRFSSSHTSDRFKTEVVRASTMLLVPTAILLYIIYFNQERVLTLLYDPRFIVSDTTARWFMLGCWIRVTSWVFLFGLFAAHRTSLIIAGELLSLPLYALLLWTYADSMTLERAAILYLISYVVYLAFNAAALFYSEHAPNLPSQTPAIDSPTDAGSTPAE